MSEPGRPQIANVEQAEGWDGDGGAHWARHADFYDATMAGLHVHLLEAAAIRSDDRVLDIGCGNGRASIDVAMTASDGEVVGVDLSSAMLSCARDRAASAGVSNVSFRQGDAQVYPFEPAEFTAAFSRNGTMFFADQSAAFANIRAGLAKGSRLTLLSWRSLAENEWMSSFRNAMAVGRTLPTPPPGVPSPFRHADSNEVTAILKDAGYESVTFDKLDEPMYFGADAVAAYTILSESLAWMVEGLEQSQQDEADSALRQLIAEHETPNGVMFNSASWLISAIAQ